jgi:hypothetical protein
VSLHVLDEAAWAELGPWLRGDEGAVAPAGIGVGAGAVAFFCPRGVGPSGLGDLPTAKRTHLLRRLLLVGESLESGQVWDVRQAVAALRGLPGMSDVAISLRAQGVMAANVVYASLFVDGLAALELSALPVSHREGPTYLNVQKHMEIPDALLMACERVPVTVRAPRTEDWSDTRAAAEALGLSGQLRIVAANGQ